MSIFWVKIRGKCLVFIFASFSLFSVQPSASAEVSLSMEDIYPTMEEMSLEDYMQRVVDFNETVQSKLLGFHAARRQRMAEMGPFEPTLVTGGTYADRRWPQANIGERTQGWVDAALNAALNGQDPPPEDLYPYIGEERNRRYSSDVEILSPIGTRVRIGARADDIRRNFAPSPSHDSKQSGYSTSIGISVEQPLLQGLGFASNLASLRLAARQSEIAFQEYRRELMKVVSAAEMAYWELYYAQEEYVLSKESVTLAETLLSDSRASFDAGRGSKLDVLEAEAGLAIRRSRQSDAYLKRIEAMNQMASFFGGVPRSSAKGCVAIDSPISKPVDLFFDVGIERALVMNPDLLRARLLKEQEKIRYGFAKNQRLPELNLTAGVDLAGHGLDWDMSNQDIEDLSFPAWSAGLVLRVPLWGDVRKRNEMWAAKLRFLEAERTESSLITQLRVGRDTSEKRVDANYMTARSLEQVVEFRDNLLDTRMQSRDVGRMDARSVLEAEQELFVARLEQLQSEVECQRALLELQLISGNLLQMRNIEVTFTFLEEQSHEWARISAQDGIGLDYMVADPARIQSLEAVPFGGDPAGAPWLGIGWGRKSTSESTYSEEGIDEIDAKNLWIRRLIFGRHNVDQP